jgi:hypothetical protein
MTTMASAINNPPNRATAKLRRAVELHPSSAQGDARPRALIITGRANVSAIMIAA